MRIESGTLVKATENYFSEGEYFIGRYIEFKNGYHMVTIGKEIWDFDNATEIPVELVKHLDAL